MTDIIERIERGETDFRVRQNIPATASLEECEKAEKQDVLDRAELLRLAKLGQTMQWIPVMERLPKIDQLVLVAKGDWFNLRCLNIDSEGNASWWDQIHGEYLDLGDYTHWMILPDSHKKERESDANR